jgi:hypothetical protein
VGENENRRDTRYVARIVAKVVRRGETIELLTNDVSFRGAFLRTDSPPAMRQLVKVTFTLPTGEHVSGHAMVVHAVPPPGDKERGPGFGLQFWGPMDGGKGWEQFIHELRKEQSKPQLKAQPPVQDKVRRASERFRLAIDVVMDGKTVVTRDISETGMAIRTDSPLQVGMKARIRLRAGDDAIEIDVVVRRQIAERAFPGLGVEYLDQSPGTRQRILAFIQRHGPKEEAVFVAPGDPKLH